MAVGIDLEGKKEVLGFVFYQEKSGSTIGFMGLTLGLIRGSMAVWRGCGSWGQRSFRKPLDSEMPPQKRG